VNANTWMVGEEIYTPFTPGDALRYMDNPRKDGASLDYAPDYNDSVDVHYTSGIPNLAFYLMAQGGKHPRNKTPYTVPGVGMETASAIWYRALSTYMTPNETYEMARADCEHAAKDLFPADAQIAVGFAWATVGVGMPPDIVAPTISITSPSATDIVEQGFTITATASDDRDLVRVDFSIDGEVVGSATAAPYTFKTATNLAYGEHLVEATAYDTINMASDSVTVNLIDPTCGNTCTASETCDMDTGECVAKPDNGGGCCSTGSPGVGGSVMLFGLCALVLGRRRRR